MSTPVTPIASLDSPAVASLLTEMQTELANAYANMATAQQAQAATQQSLATMQTQIATVQKTEASVLALLNAANLKLANPVNGP